MKLDIKGSLETAKVPLARIFNLFVRSGFSPLDVGYLLRLIESLMENSDPELTRRLQDDVNKIESRSSGALRELFFMLAKEFPMKPLGRPRKEETNKAMKFFADLGCIKSGKLKLKQSGMTHSQIEKATIIAVYGETQYESLLLKNRRSKTYVHKKFHAIRKRILKLLGRQAQKLQKERRKKTLQGNRRRYLQSKLALVSQSAENPASKTTIPLLAGD